MWGQQAKDGQGYTSKGFDYQTDFGTARWPTSSSPAPATPTSATR